MSAWWPLLATKKIGWFLSHIGVITVKSGKWDPPAQGWLVKIISSLCQLGWFAICHFTVSYILPKWTGIWGALATNEPSGQNKAHEKSNLSLMFVEHEVFYNVLPIYSAIDINLFPKILNSIGLHLIFLEGWCSLCSLVYSMVIFPNLVIIHSQSGSIMIVLV